MARPTRPGIDYFPMDVEFEDNVKIVIAIHKHPGISVLLRLWQKIYSLQGYYAEWKKKNAILFADDMNVAIETLDAIIETCFAEEIFHRGIYEKHGVLTSSGIQKRWLRIVTDLKRKDCKVDTNFDVLLFIPVETPIIPVETPVSSLDNATKEKKGKERKRKESSRAKNAQGQIFEIEDGKIWTIIVETWFLTYESEFKEKPSFAGRDPGILKQLVKLIKAKVLSVPGFPWSAETCKMHFDRFLQIALLDKWLRANFLLQNLVSQFDKIITNGRTQSNQQPVSGGSGPVAAPGAKLGTSAARTEALKSWGSGFLTGNQGDQGKQSAAG